MATDRTALRHPRARRDARVGGGAFAIGALLIAGEAAVHIQQYVTVVYNIRWVGPLFVAQAVACAAVVVALAFTRTRRLAALAGIVISAAALAALVVSYGRGLFGFYEAGFRGAIALAVVTELGAVLLLSVALALTTTLVPTRDMHAWVEPADQLRAPTDPDSKTAYSTTADATTADSTTGAAGGFGRNRRSQRERVGRGR
jgi:hypothetical protein